MALILDVTNLALVTNEDRLGKLILAKVTALVARGWTVQGSGDGIATYQNAGQTAGPYNVFTSGTGYVTTGGVWAAALGGANKISNARAWIRLREPSPSVREIIIQRSSTTTTGGETYMIAGIAYAGYLANNATANTPPTSAGVNQVLFGTAFNGVGAEYLGTTALIAGSNTLIYNLLVSDVVKGGNSWPFIDFVYNSTTATRQCGWIYESLLDVVSGDADPVISTCGLFTTVFGTPNGSPITSVYGRRDDGTAVTTLALMSMNLGSFGSYPNTTPIANTTDSKIRALPYYVGNNVSLDGRWKGRCEHIVMNMQARNYPSTWEVASASPKLYMGNMMIPWKQATTPGT